MKKITFIIVLMVQILCAQNKTLDVFFETARYNISVTEKQKLANFISSLDTSLIASISIYGFCDDRGTQNYNLLLSRNRANAIKSFFISNSVDENKIVTTSGKGEVPLKGNKNTNIHSERSMNRRVNISIVYKSDEVDKQPKSDTKILVIKGPPNENIEKLKEEFRAGDKIRFENLYFEIGYSFLIPESKKELEKIAEILVKRDNIFFTIEGHVCCTSDSRDAIDNKTKKRNLSIARAKYIYDFLAEKGVKKYRMKYVGKERKFPLGGDPKYDRRVEFLITFVGEEN